MKRLPLIVLALAVSLAIYGCGLTSEVSDEDEVEDTFVDEETTTTTLVVGAADDSGQAGGVLEIATLLPIGSELSGDLEFEAVAGDLTYVAPLSLRIVPIDSDEVDNELLTLLEAEGDELLKDTEHLFEGAAVLTQPRGDGTDQTTYGRAGALSDGSLRVITAARDDSFLEAFVIELEPFEGWPLVPGDVPVNGATAGVPPDATLEEAIRIVAAFYANNPPPEEDYLWGSYIAGQMRSGALPPSPSLAGEIIDQSSGTFEGEAWIKLNLAGPIVVEDERKRYSIEFGTNEGDLIIAAYNVEPGNDPFSTSFCVGNTPSCPDGLFPIVAEPTATGDALVFSFNTDAFANSTDPTFKAFVETGPADSPEDRVTVDFLGGERFPLLTDESDPC